METEKRRAELLKLLCKSSKPLTGAELAGYFGVSRQVIVQDIAILRASGEQIVASLRGYLMMPQQQKAQVRTVVACRHTREQIEDELGIIVDRGGRIIDVIVEHPIYGELRGTLLISSRLDLNIFLKSLETTEASPLLALTGGVHLHTVEAAEQKNIEDIIASLDKAGYLVK
jgi:transcriptional regulator of NAD metabolism